MNTRKKAYEIIEKTIKESSYSNLLLRKNLNMFQEQDRAFITNLVYGVLKNYESLKFQLEGLYEKTSFKIELILIMSLYEKFILEKEDYVTINEYVELADNKFDKNFVNAILHKVGEYKTPTTVHALNNLPEWIYNLLSKQYEQKDLDKILKIYKQESKVYYRINKHKCTFDDLNYLNINIIDDFFFTSDNNLLDTDEFKEGYFYIQDINSSIMINNLSLNKDDIFLDACSAPGSKLFNALDYVNSSNVYSNDLNDKRIKLISKKAQVLGFSGIKYSCLDAQHLSKHLNMKFNKILLDVPCSGLGVIGRRPDIKFHVNDQSLDELQEIQKNILDDVSNLLLKDGLICYSTCTLNKKENTRQINNFLESHNDFVLLKEETIIKDFGDMFYYAILKRV